MKEEGVDGLRREQSRDAESRSGWTHWVNAARALTQEARSCVTALSVVWMRVVTALPVAVCRGALLRRRGVLGRHRDVDVAVVWGAVLEPVAVPEEGAVGGEVAVGRWRLAFLPAEKSGNERARSGFLTEGAISEWWIVTNL
jgi:hypothetical protein